eukprot:gene1099-1434_t
MPSRLHRMEFSSDGFDLWVLAAGGVGESLVSQQAPDARRLISSLRRYCAADGSLLQVLEDLHRDAAVNTFALSGPQQQSGEEGRDPQ